LERFFGVLIEHYGGAFPLWLSPTQAVVLPISEKFAAYGESVHKQLREAGFRVDLDASAEKVGAKVRTATMLKTPYMLVVGGREAENGTVSVRTREGQDLGVMPLDDFKKKLAEQVAAKN
jgi:threonyl-tRNA synthetase